MTTATASPLGDLIAALRAALAADPGVAALVGARVHDLAPRNAEMPYLAVDEGELRDLSGLETPLAELRLTLRAFSRSGGRGEALAVIAAATAALQDAPALVGHRLVLLDVAEAGTRTLRDRVTAEASLRLRALVEPISP